MKKLRFYVYELIDPRDSAVFYVGKGKGDRLLAHEREAKTRADHPKHDRIRAIWAGGFTVKRRVVKKFASEKAAYKFEEKRIAEYDRKTLCNIHAGGEIKFAPISESEKEKRYFKALYVIGAKTDGFKDKDAKFHYAGEMFPLGIDRLNSFAKKFNDLFAKHGEKWAREAVA
jgi:hypothetical protein